MQHAQKPKLSRAEVDAINARVAVLRAEDATATEELADATHNGAETWHDNSAFDAAKDKKNLAQVSLGKLLTLLRHADVIEPPETIDIVTVGTAVRYRDEELGTEHEVNLAGDGAWLMGGEWASAYAPLGQLLVGGRIGQTLDGQIGPRLVQITIIDIKPL